MVNGLNRGDVVIAEASFGTHPFIIVEVGGGVQAVSVTSQGYHDGDPDYVKIPQGDGGLHKESFAYCAEVYELNPEDILLHIGEIDSSTYMQIQRSLQPS